MTMPKAPKRTPNRGRDPRIAALRKQQAQNRHHQSVAQKRRRGAGGGDPNAWKGDGPYITSDAGRLDITNDPYGFYDYLGQQAGLGVGALNPFGQFLANDVPQMMETRYNQARLQDPNLHRLDFMATQGANTVPVDTGNPYTSSSGIGRRPNPQQRPAAFKKWKKGRKKEGQTAPQEVTAGNLAGYANMLRMQFNSLAPTVRGEVSQEMPGRWSAWG